MLPTQVGETYSPSQIPSAIPSMMPTVGVVQGFIGINLTFAGTPQEQLQLATDLTNFLAQYGT
jgi:hypothetical protein